MACLAPSWLGLSSSPSRSPPTQVPEQQSAGKAFPPCPSLWKAEHFRQDPGWLQKSTNREGLSHPQAKVEGRQHSLRPHQLGLCTCCALIDKLNPWQWLAALGHGSLLRVVALEVALQPLI